MRFTIWDLRLTSVGPALTNFRITKTEPLWLRTSRAEAKAGAAPRGLGRDGYKPLMRSRVPHDGASPTGYAARETFHPDSICLVNAPAARGKTNAGEAGSKPAEGAKRFTISDLRFTSVGRKPGHGRDQQGPGLNRLKGPPGADDQSTLTNFASSGLPSGSGSSMQMAQVGAEPMLLAFLFPTVLTQRVTSMRGSLSGSAGGEHKPCRPFALGGAS